MLTIFTNPRPFKGNFDRIQRNALKSWIKFGRGCQIILFEDEEKTASKVAEEFGLECITDVKCNEFGTPLIDDVIKKSREMAKFEIVAQVNTDVILMGDFFDIVRKVKDKFKNQNFFMAGQRYNVDTEDSFDFNDPQIEKKLEALVFKKGRLYSKASMDYWVFPRSFDFKIPPFVIGRPCMDGWIVSRSRFLGAPVVDTTAAVRAIHQNHNYPHEKKEFFETEKRRNLILAGGMKNVCTLREADWVLSSTGEFKRPGFPRIIFARLFPFYWWRVFYSAVRILRQKCLCIIKNILIRLKGIKF